MDSNKYMHLFCEFPVWDFGLKSQAGFFLYIIACLKNHSCNLQTKQSFD